MTDFLSRTELQGLLFLFHRPLEIAHLSLLCSLVSLACSEAEQDSHESQFVILCYTVHFLSPCSVYAFKYKVETSSSIERPVCLFTDALYWADRQIINGTLFSFVCSLFRSMWLIVLSMHRNKHALKHLDSSADLSYSL